MGFKRNLLCYLCVPRLHGPISKQEKPLIIHIQWFVLGVVSVLQIGYVSNETCILVLFAGNKHVIEFAFVETPLNNSIRIPSRPSLKLRRRRLRSHHWQCR